MKQPHEYQRVGAAFLADGASLLADDAGLGKTIQAIEAMKALGARRVLVLCPAVALGVWRGEVADCWPECVPILLRDVVNDERVAKSLIRLAWEGCFALITGYEYLLVGNPDGQRAVATIGTTVGFDALVLDEAHKLKNPAAQITMMVYGAHCAGGPGSLVGMAGRVMLLTATPQLNHPGEWYPHMRALDPERLSMRSYDAFTHRYCTHATKTVKTRTGRSMNIEVIDGANRAEVPDLARRLRGFWLRRRIGDVRGELPPVQVVVRTLEPELCDARWLAEAEDSDEAKQLRHALANGSPAALAAIEGQVSRLRRLLATAKIPATIEVVRDLLDQGVAKVAVWGIHVEPLQKIAAALDALLITGETPKREEVARQFQTDPDQRVFVGQIVAAGTAIDLDAADRVVFHEQAWTPALNYQAIMRHRRAAKAEVKPLLVEVLAVRGSIDHAVAEILAKKSADIALLEEAS